MRKQIALLAAAAVGAFSLPAAALAQHEGHDGSRPPVTRAELQKQLASRFAAVDTNKDGAITKAEADAHRETMKKQWAEHREKRHAEHFAAMDTNKDGQISKAEFDAFHSNHARKGTEAGKGHGEGGGMMHRMHGGMGGGDLFARADANKDGKVTLAEFSAKPLQWFDKADANKDGTVTPEERRAAWEKMRAGWKSKAAKPAG